MLAGILSSWFVYFFNREFFSKESNKIGFRVIGGLKIFIATTYAMFGIIKNVFK